jgi:hypothetical protein
MNISTYSSSLILPKKKKSVRFSMDFSNETQSLNSFALIKNGSNIQFSNEISIQNNYEIQEENKFLNETKSSNKAFNGTLMTKIMSTAANTTSEEMKIRQKSKTRKNSLISDSTSFNTNNLNNLPIYYQSKISLSNIIKNADKILSTSKQNSFTVKKLQSQETSKYVADLRALAVKKENEYNKKWKIENDEKKRTDKLKKSKTLAEDVKFEMLPESKKISFNKMKSSIDLNKYDLQSPVNYPLSPINISTLKMKKGPRYRRGSDDIAERISSILQTTEKIEETSDKLEKDLIIDEFLSEGKNKKIKLINSENPRLHYENLSHLQFLHLKKNKPELETAKNIRKYRQVLNKGVNSKNVYSFLEDNIKHFKDFEDYNMGFKDEEFKDGKEFSDYEVLLKNNLNNYTEYNLKREKLEAEDFLNALNSPKGGKEGIEIQLKNFSTEKNPPRFIKTKGFKNFVNNFKLAECIHARQIKPRKPKYLISSLRKVFQETNSTNQISSEY